MVTPPAKIAKAPGPKKAFDTANKIIDWAAVERDFRTNKLTYREMTAKHGVSGVSIWKKSIKLGWTRDLADAVNVATKALLTADAVKNAVTAQIEQNVKEGLNETTVAVLAAAELNKQVILTHRNDAVQARVTLDKAKTRVLAIIDNAKDPKTVVSLVGAVESLSRTTKNVIEIERKAYNLDRSEETPPEDDLSDDELDRRIAAALAK